MIEVTVRLDESAIQAAADDVWKALLSPSDYRSRHGGSAYSAIATSCNHHVSSMDLRPFIDSAVSRLMQATVDEVVQEHLRAAAKKRLKTMPAADLLRITGGDQS